MQQITIGTTTNYLVLQEQLDARLLLIDRIGGNFSFKAVHDPEYDLTRMPVTHAVGIVGCIRIETEGFIILITKSTLVAEFTFGEQKHQIVRIQEVEMISLLTGRTLNSSAIGDEKNAGPTAALLRLLSSGHFYLSPTFDLTNHFQRLQTRFLSNTSGNRWQGIDDRFFWNKFLVRDFLDAGLDNWVCPLVQGFIDIRYTSISRCSILLISRRSKFRAGTRYFDRGVDDDGKVANFCETEQILFAPDGNSYVSFVQTRGSVPVFWEQQAGTIDLKNLNFKELGKNMGKKKKIQILRTPDATKGVFAKHFKTMVDTYGIQVIINLLSIKKEGEIDLTNAYQSHFATLRSPNCKYVYWDFHEYCKGNNFSNVSILLQKLAPDFEMLGCHYYSANEQVQKETQRGVFRTNCKDCLDRTNIVQSLIARHALEMHFRKLCPGGAFQEVDSFARDLWLLNGDAVSQCYAGSSSMKSTLVGGWMSKLGDGKISLERALQATFLDSKKQEAIAQLLGTTTAVTSFCTNKKTQSRDKVPFVDRRSFEIRLSTYNVNGVPAHNFKLPDLLRVVQTLNDSLPVPHIFVMGFQEIVDLTPGKVLNNAASDIALSNWGSHLTALLDSIAPHQYVCLSSSALIGIGLLVFVQNSVLPFVRDVQHDEVKVGLGGIAGNKGACGVRLTICNSLFEFVVGHFAAGESPKDATQRNSDYHTIRSMMFSSLPRVPQNPSRLQVWLGDFNYRLDGLAQDEVMIELSNRGQCQPQNPPLAKIERLIGYDQLTNFRTRQLVFEGFEEHPVTFPPTYKYDINSMQYDTSSKARAPAWCDRVLWSTTAPPLPSDAQGVPPSRANAEPDRVMPNVLYYFSDPQSMTSDHRPVVAHLSAAVPVTDADRRAIDQLPALPRPLRHPVDQTLTTVSGSGAVQAAFAQPNFASFDAAPAEPMRPRAGSLTSATAPARPNSAIVPASPVLPLPQHQHYASAPVVNANGNFAVFPPLSPSGPSPLSQSTPVWVMPPASASGGPSPGSSTGSVAGSAGWTAVFSPLSPSSTSISSTASQLPAAPTATPTPTPTSSTRSKSPLQYDTIPSPRSKLAIGSAVGRSPSPSPRGEQPSSPLSSSSGMATPSSGSETPVQASSVPGVIQMGRKTSQPTRPASGVQPQAGLSQAPPVPQRPPSGVQPQPLAFGLVQPQPPPAAWQSPPSGGTPGSQLVMPSAPTGSPAIGRKSGVDPRFASTPIRAGSGPGLQQALSGSQPQPPSQPHISGTVLPSVPGWNGYNPYAAAGIPTPQLQPQPQPYVAGAGAAFLPPSFFHPQPPPAQLSPPSSTPHPAGSFWQNPPQP